MLAHSTQVNLGPCVYRIDNVKHVISRLQEEHRGLEQNSQKKKVDAQRLEVEKVKTLNVLEYNLKLSNVPLCTTTLLFFSFVFSSDLRWELLLLTL